ncbi:MAG: hypothetical protein ACOCXP_02715, partial [Candidatus Dojkabacteria bacterium]
VAQAPKSSGALSTAWHCFNYSRVLFAGVSSVSDPAFEGCFELLDREWASPITNTAWQLQLQLAAAVGLAIKEIKSRQNIDDRITKLNTHFAGSADSFGFELAIKVMAGYNSPASLNAEFARKSIQDIKQKIKELQIQGILASTEYGRLDLRI